MGLHRARALPHRTIDRGQCVVCRKSRVSPAKSLGTDPGRPGRGKGKEAPCRQGISPGRVARGARDVPCHRASAAPHRSPIHSGSGSHGKRARRADRRARRVGEDRRPDRAPRGVGRGARCGPRSGSRGNPRLQGPRAQLPARSAATAARASDDRGCRPCRTQAKPSRDGAGIPRTPAAGRRAEPRELRHTRRRLSGGGGARRRLRRESRVRLQRLRLVNFRQHADTEIAFGDGITGIIGPNGSGKTSLLEAIAWAIYGNPAARGDKDSIRNLRAKARAPMRVELEFSLGNRTYVVERKLNEATLHENGIVVANSIKEVTARLQRVLGMTHDEFFNTYFTGQKDLAVLADASRPERAAFLSRVLRHEQLTVAQERVRERRNAIGHEVDGLETGLPAQSELEKERNAATARLTEARKAAATATTARQKAQQTLAEEEPRWQQWVERRERTCSLHGDLRVAEQGVVVARQEFQRLDKELAEALGAREELRKLDADVAPITRLKAELVELDRLHREDAARREEQAKITELTRNLSVLDRRIAELADAEAELERVTTQARDLKERLGNVDKAAREQQGNWIREKEYASTKRAELLKQHDEVKDHRDKILKLGPEGECPTCRRPLGAEHDAVLGVLDRQLEAIVEDGKYFKQRIEQLTEPPKALAEAEAARDAVREEARVASEKDGTLREQVRERARLQKERAGLAKRTEEMERRAAARAGGYNADRHNDVRAELARLEPVALQAAALKARAERAEALVREAELAEKALSAREEHVK